MSGAAAGGRDGGDLPERRGDARRESGLDDSGADDRELPPSDATENALRVQSLDIPAVAAQLSLSPRGLLSRLLRGSDSEGEGNVVTVDVPVVRDEDPPGGGANHDARSSLSSSFLSRRARRAEATDAANAAASRALFAATATEPPTRLASLSLNPTTEDERLESLAPLLERGAGAREGRAPPGRASPWYAQTETDSADGFRGYLVGVPVGSALDRDRNASAEACETLETGETDEARLARAVADATDGEVGENAAAAAAARVCGDHMGNQSETRLAAADDDVRVRRVIFAVPSRTSFGEGTAFDSRTASGASPETLPSDSQRRPLKFGGASTRFSLPTAVTNVTLETRTGDERDASDDARTVTVDDASSNGNGASSERSFFVANGVSESERKPPNTAYAMRRLRASVVVERRVPVIGWLILAAAVVSLSAMGTMVTLERSKPFTQSSWRAQSVLLIAAPWAAAKLKKQGLRGFRAARTRRRALLVALCWSGWFLTLFYGLATTSIAHAYVLTNTTSAVIVVHTFLTGNAVPRSHVAGVALAMAGAGVVMWQSSFQSSGDAKKNGASSGAATVAGDAVVAAGAVSGAAFLLLAKTTREEVELSLLLVLQMLVNLPISLALALSLEGCSFVTPLDAKRGVFGWLAPSQIGKQLVISVCGTIIGTCGYVASLKYLAPTVVAIAMLCEPILAALIGWAAGVNAFPDWKTCSGMALVALGTAVIAVDAGRARARAVDVDAHRNAANG